MAIIFRISLLVGLFQPMFTPTFAINRYLAFGTCKEMVGFCDAPAPENFHVAAVGADLVSLSWVPAWTGATHTLELYLEINGDWAVSFTGDNIPGDAYTLNDLAPGYYKAKISTNCPSGETSAISSELFFRFKIVELSTAGRIPISPVEVEDCGDIDYLNHEWVGFKVTEIETGESNLFEFTWLEGEDPAIKRVYYDHPIVAVDDDGFFPTDLFPILKTPTPFRMVETQNGDPTNAINIGYVICFDNYTSPPTITLCKDENNPVLDWKPEYSFTAMTAESVLDDSPPNGGSSDRTVWRAIEHGKFKAQSPFGECLNIFPPIGFVECHKASISVLNTKGQTVIADDFELNDSQVSLPAASLLPGLYLIKIETICDVHLIKAIKSR